MDLEKISLEFTASAGNASKTFDALEKRLSRLQTALDKIDTSGLDRMAQHFEKLNSTLSSFKANTDVGKSLSTVATAMNRFATVDTAAVARANSVLASMTGTLNSLPTVDVTKTASLANLATSLNAFGRVRSVSGISGLSSLSKSISQLMVSMGGMDIALFQNVTAGLLNLANSLNILGRVNAEKAIKNLPKLAKGIKMLMNSLARAPTISQELINMTEALAMLASQGSKVGTAATGLNKALGNTATSSSRGATGLRLFGNTAKAQRRHIKSLASVVGGLIAKYWVLWRAIQSLGNMAGIASNLVEVQNVVDHTFGQMQYKLNEFTQDSIDKFGLSTLQAKQYASRFQSMGMAMGITNQQVANSADFVSSHLSEQSKELYNAGDSLADMSINLTKLSADYASFYDVDPAESFEKFQSVLTGQARPLRAYGLDLTQATVQEWALKNGIEANMSAMSQAEKAMLRYQYVMAQSSHITSDFARTSDTYHNTLTRLKANFATLKGTIGTSLMNLFKPIMVIVNNAIVVINRFAKAVGDSLGKILGWKYEVGSGAIAMDDVSDSVDDLGGGLGKAGKAAKELKKQLQGFDELNNLSLDDNNGGGGSGGSGGGVGGGSAADMAGQWVKTESLFESDWDTWFKLGRGISEAWTEGLNSIPWDSVYEGARNFGTGLAEFLNGLITPELFGAVGRTIAGSLNTAIYAALAFGQALDWTQMGEAIASGINNFFSTWDYKATAQAINTWREGIFDMLNTAITGINWSEIGTEIGKFINEIDWGGLFLDLTELAMNILVAIKDGLLAIGEENPIAAGIIGIILAIKFMNKLNGIGSKILNAIGLDISTSQTSGGIASNLYSKISTACNSYFGTNPLVVAVAVAASWKLGESIGKQLGNEIFSAIADEDLSQYYKDFHWFGSGGFFDEISDDWSITTQAIKDMWDDTVDYIYESDTFDRFYNSGFAKGLREFFGVEDSEEDIAKIEAKGNKVSSGANYRGVSGKFGESGGGLTSFFREVGKSAESAEKSVNKLNGGFRQNVTDAKKANKENVSLANVFGTKFKTPISNVNKSFLTLFNNINSETNNTHSNTLSKFSSIKDSVVNNVTQSSDTSKSKFNEMSANAQTNTASILSTVKDKLTSAKTETVTNANGMSSNWSSNMSAMNTKTTNDTVSMKNTIDKWSINAKNTVTNTKANATFGVNTPTQQSIVDKLTNLKNKWTGKNTSFGIDTPAHSTITNALNGLKRLWTGKNTTFGVNTTSQNEVSSAWQSVSSFWHDKTANFKLDFAADASSAGDILSKVANAVHNAFANSGSNTLSKIAGAVRKSIRGYATGGVFDEPTLGIFGEAGAEAVVPLERNLGWLGKMSTLLANEMQSRQYTPPTYAAPAYNSSPYQMSNTYSNNNAEAVREQNALLREQNALLRQIADKDVSISSRDVFNAVKQENNDYVNRTGNSPFIV